MDDTIKLNCEQLENLEVSVQQYEGRQSTASISIVQNQEIGDQDIHLDEAISPIVDLIDENDESNQCKNSSKNLHMASVSEEKDSFDGQQTNRVNFYKENIDPIQNGSECSSRVKTQRVLEVLTNKMLNKGNTDREYHLSMKEQSQLPNKL